MKGKLPKKPTSRTTSCYADIQGVPSSFNDSMLIYSYSLYAPQAEDLNESREERNRTTGEHFKGSILGWALYHEKTHFMALDRFSDENPDLVIKQTFKVGNDISFEGSILGLALVKGRKAWFLRSLTKNPDLDIEQQYKCFDETFSGSILGWAFYMGSPDNILKELIAKAPDLDIEQKSKNNTLSFEGSILGLALGRSVSDDILKKLIAKNPNLNIEQKYTMGKETFSGSILGWAFYNKKSEAILEKLIAKNPNLDIEQKLTKDGQTFKLNLPESIKQKKAVWKPVK